MFYAAAIQLTSSDDITANIAQATVAIETAVARGARLIVLPENAFFMRREGATGGDFLMQNHPGVLAMQALAAQHAVDIIIGSVRATSEETRPSNRLVCIDHCGHIAAHYDKIHLFDVEVEGGHSYQESRSAKPGDTAVLWHSQRHGLIGLSICYDLRFPYLFAALAKAGAEILVVPSAFTVPTGRAHWESLLRARAIETGSYVIAPAQCGTHPGGRETYGHSLMIDPWGCVLAAAGTTPEVVMAEINLAEVARVRTQIPALQHQRESLRVTVI
jgi:deaminated glutathione amidase